VSVQSAMECAVGRRPEIQRSWERSRSCGVLEDWGIDLPFEPNVHAEERFLRAAKPVLDSLGPLLRDSQTTVVLTTRDGVVIDRRCEDVELRRRLDETQSVQGFRWSEEFCGTTALSVAMEEHAPAWVAAGDHYLESLRHLACAAVPIVHPITMRTQGLIDITACLGDASRHMMPIAIQAARAIEERLYEAASEAERILLAHFLAVAHRPGRPVIVLGERLELSTPPAARMLDADDKALLWERASETVRDRTASTLSITLASGDEITGRVVAIEHAGRNVGVSIELTAPRPTRAAIGEPLVSVPGSTFVGRSAAARYVAQRVAELRGQPIPLMVVGEAGSGKLAVAKAIAGTTQTILLDASRAALDQTESELLRQADRAAEQPGCTIIVRRAGGLSPDAIELLRSIAVAAEANGSRVIATRTVAPDETPGEGFGLELVVPPLRERIDDLLDLVPHLIGRRGAQARMAPAALQALMRNDWPGNVRELDSVIRVLLTRKRTTDIVLADLPEAYRPTNQRLRRIDQVERAAIVQALAEADGNKTRAAELLEIGRATLYRKLRTYRLDLDHTTA
jgi:transcriptional regulator of acetoin/glycerol metabolism